jgi:hypothetical protein
VLRGRDWFQTAPAAIDAGGELTSNDLHLLLRDCDRGDSFHTGITACLTGTPFFMAGIFHRRAPSAYISGSRNNIPA